MRTPGEKRDPYMLFDHKLSIKPNNYSIADLLLLDSSGFLKPSPTEGGMETTPTGFFFSAA